MALEGWMRTEQTETKEEYWEADVVGKHARQRKQQVWGQDPQKRHKEQQTQIIWDIA